MRGWKPTPLHQQGQSYREDDQRSDDPALKCHQIHAQLEYPASRYQAGKYCARQEISPKNE